MYKIIKEAGNNSNIILKNTETKAEVNLGRLSTRIIDILERQGYSFGEGDSDKTLKYKSEWSISVDEEAKEELAKLAMPMKKPIRDQRKKKEDLFKKPNKEIDAMDVLLGLASYN